MNIMCDKPNKKIPLKLRTQPKEETVCNQHLKSTTDQIQQPKEDILCNQQLSSITDRIRQLEEEVIKLKAENGVLKTQTHIVNNNTQNINTQNINIVVPPSFGKNEDCLHYLRRFPKLLKTALDKHPGNCILYLIQNTTCNPNTPIYNRLHLTNPKAEFIKVSSGDKYVIKNTKHMISELIDNKRGIIEDYIDEHSDQCSSKILTKYEQYIQNLDKDKDVRRQLEKNIICDLVNIKDIIGSDDWTKKLLSDLSHIKESDTFLRNIASRIEEIVTTINVDTIKNIVSTFKNREPISQYIDQINTNISKFSENVSDIKQNIDEVKNSDDIVVDYIIDIGNMIASINQVNDDIYDNIVSIKDSFDEISNVDLTFDCTVLDNIEAYINEIGDKMTEIEKIIIEATSSKYA